MTAVLERPDSPSQWGSMPGWTVVADMTPLELINLRWLAVLRRRIALGLALVVALCAAGYAYAYTQNGTASDDAAAATMQTTTLARSISSYAQITQIETTVTGIRTQVATLMSNDVDIAHLIAAIRAALPNTMSIQNLTLTVNPTSTPSSGLDASGHLEIGTVTLSGSARTLNDLPAFVDHLTAMPGIANVLPATNELSTGIAQFSLTMSLTDQLYSHRFDLSNTGGN